MEVRIHEDERIDDLEYKNLKIIQKKDGFCFGMDSILLTNFAKISRKKSVVADLGTGTGIISILLCAKNENIDKIYGFDIQEDICEMAKRSVEINDLNDKIKVMNEDIVGISKRNWNKKFDVVVSNPPYKKINTGLVSEENRNLISRHEIKCKLEDIIYESSKILKDYGTFYMVHRPDRLVDICQLMRENKLEPKEIRLVYPHYGDEANIILIKGVKCGKVCLKVWKPLIVYNENGEYTDEILQIYGKNRE